MKISVVVPSFNEEKPVHSTLDNLFMRHSPDEVIVVDGGSSDKTAQIAGEWTRVIPGRKGRAEQMNEGARKASGDVLLFLYPGTKLPAKAFLKIKDAIREGAHAGRFTMSFEDRKWIHNLYAQFTKFTFFSYGDQGFFVRKEVFDELGGFREDIPFEDMDFYRRLCRSTQPVIIQDAVVNSGARYSGFGAIGRNLLNLLVYGISFRFLFKSKRKSPQNLR